MLLGLMCLFAICILFFDDVLTQIFYPLKKLDCFVNFDIYEFFILDTNPLSDICFKIFFLSP